MQTTQGDLQSHGLGTQSGRFQKLSPPRGRLGLIKHSIQSGLQRKKLHQELVLTVRQLQPFRELQGVLSRRHKHRQQGNTQSLSPVQTTGPRAVLLQLAIKQSKTT